MNAEAEIPLEETKARVEGFVSSLTKLLLKHADEHKVMFHHHEVLIAHDEKSDRILLTFALLPKRRR